MKQNWRNSYGFYLLFFTALVAGIVFALTMATYSEPTSCERVKSVLDEVGAIHAPNTTEGYLKDCTDLLEKK